ncbi:hypothetical protein C3941_24020 [Kaistia algarum]|uniref:hypothetical protein n=1 Tax=Kaistia algarum TaxID=2083279 RepID=UPI000D3F870E|nr:hypothetical protein [Kaistia algarum]MCX5514251.1 hypothetical protein [Kaistia algarum]PPE77362.1 hypothetical protein C3941_24020 [Kaistia algarum]
MPIRTDISLWRGNNAPDLIWTLPDTIPSGASYSLTVAAGGQILFSRETPSGSLGLDTEAKELRWTPTLAESRLVPAGRVATYEIEQRVGDIETTLVFGSITGLGGGNSDAGSPAGATMLDAADPDNIPLFLLGWLA